MFPTLGFGFSMPQAQQTAQSLPAVGGPQQQAAPANKPSPAFPTLQSQTTETPWQPMQATGPQPQNPVGYSSDGALQPQRQRNPLMQALAYMG